MTQEHFLTTYKACLIKTYQWARISGKLDTFMESVADTLNGTQNLWNNQGDCVVAAWKAIGGIGTPTYKALRALK